MATGTQIPVLSQTDLTNRFLALFPTGWSSDVARQPGGILYALFKALSGSLSDLLGSSSITPPPAGYATIQFAHDLTRIGTATGSGLDTISQDYFGTTLPRLPGESDTAFRARILLNLLLPKVTRPALANILQNITGKAPTMIEPWNPGDTCAWDERSFWDINWPGGGATFLWGDQWPWLGFIRVALSVWTLTGAWPVWGWDAGFAWDQPQSYWADLEPSSTVSLAQMAAAIQAAKAYGTTVGMRLLICGCDYSQVVTTISYGANALTANVASWVIPPYSMLADQGFIVLLETPGFLANAWINTPGNNFSVAFSMPAPTAGQLGFIALSLVARAGIPTGSLAIPIPPGTFSMTVNPPVSLSGMLPFATANWNTSIWITNLGSNSLTLNFPGAAFYSNSLVGLGWFAIEANVVGSVAISAGAQSVTISGNFSASGYGVFLTPTWNTRCSVRSKSATEFIVDFESAAPASGADLYWMAQEGI